MNWHKASIVGVITIVAVLVLGAFLLLLMGTPKPQAVDFDALATTRGHQATSLLEATGFPHASSATNESYQFQNVDDTDAPNQTVTFRVDWDTGTVQNVTAAKGDADAVIVLPPGAYHDALARFAGMTQGQVIEPRDSWSLYQQLVWHTNVHLRGSTGFASWWRDTHYRLQLGSWATEVVVDKAKITGPSA